MSPPVKAEQPRAWAARAAVTLCSSQFGLRLLGFHIRHCKNKVLAEPSNVSPFLGEPRSQRRLRCQGVVAKGVFHFPKGLASSGIPKSSPQHWVLTQSPHRDTHGTKPPCGACLRSELEAPGRRSHVRRREPRCHRPPSTQPHHPLWPCTGAAPRTELPLHGVSNRAQSPVKGRRGQRSHPRPETFPAPNSGRASRVQGGQRLEGARTRGHGDVGTWGQPAL